MLATVLQVALGGALGAVCRHATIAGAQRLVGAHFPVGVAVANVLGSLAVGFAVVLLANRELDRFSPLLITGFLGGYTTYSAYSLEFWRLISDGRSESAFAFAIGSAVLAIGAVFLGVALARSIVA